MLSLCSKISKKSLTERKEIYTNPYNNNNNNNNYDDDDNDDDDNNNNNYN